MGSEATKTTGTETGKGGSDALAKARAVRKLGAGNAYEMSEDERFALQLIRNAGKATKMLANRVQTGKPINPEVLRACSVLSGSMAGAIFE